MATRRNSGLRAKYVVFAVITAMMAYVLYHNERFLLDPAHPVWQHYETFAAAKWWLLPHGLAGACALLLAPMQFSDRLRNRFTKLHRIIGRIYVAGAFVLAPIGVYIEYMRIPEGAFTTFTLAAIVNAVLLVVVTGIGLLFALVRNIPAHRQWMTRGYAVALTFFEVRLILGVTGWDTPPDPVITEAVVWTVLAFTVLVGDLANQWYELRWGRQHPARSATPQGMSAASPVLQ